MCHFFWEAVTLSYRLQCSEFKVTLVIGYWDSTTYSHPIYNLAACSEQVLDVLLSGCLWYSSQNCCSGPLPVHYFHICMCAKFISQNLKVCKCNTLYIPFYIPLCIMQYILYSSLSLPSSHRIHTELKKKGKRSVPGKGKDLFLLFSFTVGNKLTMVHFWGRTSSRPQPPFSLPQPLQNISLL